MSSLFRDNTVFFEQNLELLYILHKLLFVWYALFPLLYIPAAIPTTQKAPHLFISYMFIYLGFTAVFTGFLIYYTNLTVFFRTIFQSLNKLEKISISIIYSSVMFVNFLTPVELQLPVLYNWLDSITASILLVNFYLVLPSFFVLFHHMLSYKSENISIVSETKPQQNSQ